MTTRQELIDQAKALEPAKKLSRKELIAQAKTIQPDPAPEAHPALKMIDDVLSAGAQGVYKTAIATPGLPGTIQEWARSLPAKTPVGQWLKDTGESLLSNLPNKGQLPTSQDILDTYEEKVTPFKEYEGIPAYAERAGEFFTPLPGTKVQLGRDALTALVGGFGSKGGEDIAKALEASPAGQAWADLIGGLTGTLVGKGKKANAVKIAAKAAPSEEQLEPIVDALYARNANQPVDRNEFYNTLQEIDADTRKLSVNPRRQAPGLFEDLGTLETENPLLLHRVEALRSDAKEHARELGPGARMGKTIAKKIDKFYANAAPNNPNLQAELNEAREKGRGLSISRDLTERRRGGDVNQMSQAIGEANAVRGYARSRKGRSFSDLEQEAVKQAVGPSMRNPLRTFSRGLQGYLTQGYGLGASMQQATLVPLMEVMGLGALGRFGERLVDRRSLKKLDDLQAIIRAGRPVQEEAVRKAAGLNKRQWDNVKATGILGTLRSQAIENNRGRD